jgi:hypothetical protein
LKEAIGGTYMLYLMAFFMIIYIFFLAAIMMYAQAYKAKNATIELLERTEEHVTSEQLCSVLMENGANPNSVVVIDRHPTNLGKSYYSVTIYMRLSILPNGIAMNFDIPIGGETKLISDEIIVDAATGDALQISSLC